MMDKFESSACTERNNHTWIRRHTGGAIDNKKIECTEEKKTYWSVQTCRGRGGRGWRGDSLEGKHKMWGDGSATGRRRAGQYGPNDYYHTFKRDSSPKIPKHKSISSYLRSRSIRVNCPFNFYYLLYRVDWRIIIAPCLYVFLGRFS